MGIAQVTHDISLQAPGGTAIGFMLAVDPKTGRKIRRKTAPRMLPPQEANSAVVYNDIPPDKRLFREQVFFDKGGGQRYYSDPRKYWTANGMDATYIDGVALTRTYTVETNIAPVITNGGFEDALGAEWTVSGATRVNTDPNEGTWHLSLLSNGSTAANAYQDLAWDAGYQGKTIVVTAAIKLIGGTGGARVTINDGVGTTVGSTITAGAWTATTVTKTLDGAATRIRITVENLSTAGTEQNYVDSVKISSPMGFCAFGGIIYAARGARLEKYVSGTWTLVTTFLHDITDMKAFNGYLFIALSDDYAYQYTSDAVTFTESNLADNKAEYFGVVGSNLVKATLANSVKTNTSGINGGAAWSSATTVGDSTLNITDVLDHPDTIIIAKQGTEIYQIVSGVASAYVESLRDDSDTNSGKRSRHWNDQVFIPSGSHDLTRIYDGVAYPIGPFELKVPSTNGRIAALADDGRSWLNAIVYGTPTNTDAMWVKGRQQTVAGESLWVWHPQAVIAGNPGVVDAIISNQNGRPRLFLAMTGLSTANFGEYIYDLDSSYVTAGCVNGGTLTTSAHDGGYRTKTKAWYSVEVQADTVNATNQDQRLQVLYSTDDGTTFTSLGYISPTTSILYFPSNTTSVRLHLRFTGVYSGSSVSGVEPVLHAYLLSGQLRIARRYMWTLAVRLSDTEKALHSLKTMDVTKRISEIKTLMNTAFPLTFVDIDKSTYYVTIEDINETYEIDPSTNREEAIVYMELQEAEWNG